MVTKGRVWCVRVGLSAMFYSFIVQCVKNKCAKLGVSAVCEE